MNKQLLTAGEHVSIASRASAAALRHGGRDYIRDADDLPDTPRVLTLSDLLQGVFTLTLKTKNGDELGLSARMVTVIIAVLGTLLLGLGGTAFYLVSGVSELKSAMIYERESRTRQENDMREYTTRVISAFTTFNAYVAADSKEDAKVFTMLSRDQQRELTEWRMSNPRPQLPSPDDLRFKFRNNNDQQEQQEEGIKLNVGSSLQNNLMRWGGFGAGQGLPDQKPWRVCGFGVGRQCAGLGASTSDRSYPLIR